MKEWANNRISSEGEKLRRFAFQLLPVGYAEHCVFLVHY